MQKITFKIYTLGCKVNQYDSGKLADLLKQKGLESAEENADIAIVNSCAVTKSAIHKSKRMLNKGRNENSGAKIVLMGCYPKVYKESIKRSEFDLVWEVGNLDRLAKEISNIKLPVKSRRASLRTPKNEYEKARYFLKIQDGCEQFCTYCIIPYARGKLQSRSQSEIIKEIKKALSSGFREFVLSGIHLGKYGKENKKIKRSKTGELAELIKKVIKIKDFGRLRLSSIEVNEISNELISLMVNEPKVCSHLHIPLQSGSNKILKSMNRPYSQEYFKNKIDKIRNLDADFAVSSDVIVGFPGETEKDFKETCNFIKNIKFSRIHIFPFSAHEKTPAYSMPNQVKDDIKKARVKELRRLGLKSEKDYRQRFLGKEVDVVIEGEKFLPGAKPNREFLGKTEYYFNVIFHEKDIINYYELKRKENLIGKIVKIKV